MWIFDGAANGTLAELPFYSGEDQTRGQSALFTRDKFYFKLHPSIRFAIRRGCLEFDWLSEHGDVPAPRIYVLVLKISSERHAVMPIFRGVPFWRESSFSYGRYAHVEHDSQAFDILVRCHAMGGMNEQARAQLDSHNLYVNQCRALALMRANNQKVN